jgi:Flagellar hook-length control protein FliK
VPHREFVSNPEFLASNLQWYVRSANTVISIVPQIGAGGTPATPALSPTSPASQAAAQPFSAVLENATSSSSQPHGTQVSTSQGRLNSDYSAVSGMTEREAKPSNSRSSDSKTSDSKTSDSKTRDGQGRGNLLIPTRAFSPDASDKPVPVVVVQTMRSPVLLADAGTKDLTAEEALTDSATTLSSSGVDSTTNQRDAKSSDSKTSDSGTSDSKISDVQGRENGLSQTPALTPDVQGKAVPTTIQSTIAPAFDWNIGIENFTSGAFVTTGALSDSHATSTSNSGTDSTAKPDAIGGSMLPPALLEDVTPAGRPSGTSFQELANMVTPDTRETGALASLVTGISGPSVSDSKTQPGSTPFPLRDVSRGRSETDNNPAQAATKSETDTPPVPLSTVPATLVSPFPISGNMEPGNSTGTLVKPKPTLDQSRISVTQEIAGTARKSIEATGEAKAQSRKDDSPSSSNSQAADQNGNVPLKAIDGSPSFSLAGNQPLSTTDDGKNVSASLSPKASDQPASQFDQEPTGVAQGQTQSEIQGAYPTSLINSAKLVERIGEAELRVGIRAGEFGSVDIRTSMVRNQFTAEISVERGDLGRVMAAELPSLQNRLAEQRVPVANITVQNHAGSHSTASEQQKPRDGQQVYSTNPASRRDEGLMPALAALEGTAPASRLDIHM